ncbi:ABC transporter substrate-binding protein [Demequina muriae]|uniref:ABC transporter substrate-binding protein n=1 Tax=Demequina muriae TaxID=3051664 RepID=A0ABT8GGL4_9MICO|nr:ABC transporter substrate-binding protein [Demequina sp. EGI L300058]MDN4480562.1 ABC transporter substrate-binding protein [Demequina sp. EGI L300058]
MARLAKALTATALASSLVALAGCSNNDEGGGDGDEPYTVNYAYMTVFGDPTQAVKDAVNELTMEELNMKVNLIPVTFADYFSQLPLKLASGTDPLDITYLFAQDAGSFIDAGYLVDANEYSDLTQDIAAMLGEDVAGAEIGGFKAGFGTQTLSRSPNALIVRKDIFDELGYSVEDFNVNTDDLSSYDAITDMFAKVQEAHPDMTMFDGTQTMGTLHFGYIDPLTDNFGVLEDYGQTSEVTNWFESDQYRAFAELNREWFVEGYSSSDIAVNQDEAEVKMQAGNLFSFIKSYSPTTQAEKEAQTGHEVEVIPLSEAGKISPPALLSVVSNSKDPAKAFEFLNWAYTSAEFNDLLNWGVEGIDWVESDEGIAAYPEGVDMSNVSYHNDAGFLLPNQFAGHVWEGNPSNMGELYEEFGNSGLVSQGYGFFFDSSSVADQIAALKAVYDEYNKQLSFGSMDPDTGLAEYNEALYQAGLQDVIDEKQRQFDEYLANN